MGDEAQDEDCLYLNIWSGASDAEERRPVIVWFHLGAFQFGSGSAPFYQGDAWARAGVVFVTFNFRLARLGFLAHPELDDEGDGRSGNYGLLDQIAALEWVRDNISSFGGDPDCVTVFGVSSGASSVSLLMASPAARGLFHRVIAESGGSFGPVGSTTGVGDRWQTAQAASRSGLAWAQTVGAARLADLRALSADQVREATARRRPVGGAFDALRPVVDGGVLPEGSRAVFEAGRQAPTPLLVGSAANEGFATISVPRDLADFRRQASQEHGSDDEAFLALYPADDDREAVGTGLRANGDRLFTWQNWTMARLHAKAGHPVYLYRFEQRPPVPARRYAEQRDSAPLDAFHGASVFYSFDHFDLRGDWPWSAEDRRVSATLIQAWVAFARTGRPAAGGLPDWPAFDPAAPKLMALSGRARLRPVPDLDRLAFWDHFYASKGRVAAAYAEMARA